MKIVLEFNERELLKRIERYGDRATTTSRSRGDLAMIREFYDAGLVRGIPLQPFDTFGPIYLTPLGVTVLKEHTPYLDPLNKAGGVWHNQSFSHFGIPK